MKKNDIILAIICGLAVAWIASDFLVKYSWIFFIILPILSIAGLLLCDIFGKKFLFIRQAGKFVLAGSFADVIDIKVFQILFLLLPFSLLVKSISFVIATAIKYWANKHWAFEKPESGQVVQFFLVTLIGLAIDVVSFYYLSRINIGILMKLWVELTIIAAAIITSIWNFLGYKFLVFKK